MIFIKGLIESLDGIVNNFKLLNLQEIVKKGLTLET